MPRLHSKHCFCIYFSTPYLIRLFLITYESFPRKPIYCLKMHVHYIYKVCVISNSSLDFIKQLFTTLLENTSMLNKLCIAFLVYSVRLNAYNVEMYIENFAKHDMRMESVVGLRSGQKINKSRALVQGVCLKPSQ